MPEALRHDDTPLIAMPPDAGYALMPLRYVDAISLPPYAAAITAPCHAAPDEAIIDADDMPLATR